ncbi:hypothetical protein EIK77_003337 [Talaromyces pinophilus]|jgi:tetrahydroxynaphthalene reductase|nr:hypothetical protein EIK77_003337 [Talaromyces pinophilus]
MSSTYIPYRLDGKVALVTGSGRGIGAAIAKQLGRLGAKVVVNYANASEAAEKVVSEIKSYGSDAVAFKADVRQVDQTARLMDDAVAHFGGLDIVCSNSGVVSFGHIGDVTEVSSNPAIWGIITDCIIRRSLIALSASTPGVNSSWLVKHTVT